MSGEEQKRIAAYLEIKADDFLSRFCEKRNGIIYVRAGEDNFCIFYRKGKGCAVHPVKPHRCSLWPYYNANVNDEETWDLAKLACRGINRECSFQEFVNQSKTAGK